MRSNTTRSRRIITLALAAFAVALVWLALAPAAANAGSYSVWTAAGINGGPASCPDVKGPFGSAGFTAVNLCDEAAGHYGISTGPGWHGAGNRGWEVFAPAGTVFTSGHVDANVDSANGAQARINVGTASVHTGTITSGTSGWQGFNWSGHGNTTRFSVFVNCPFTCGSSDGSSSWAFARNLVFHLSDSAAPGVSLGGQLASGGWRNSGGTANVSATDGGGGVQIQDILVNGERISRDNESCSTTTLLGRTMGTRLTPCPASASMSRTYTASFFEQGTNQLQACAHDFSGTGDRNERCTSTTVRIDTVAPQPPSGLAVAGGEGWRSENDFDLAWSNAAQAHAPIDGAMYRITRVGGGYDSGARFVSGNDRRSLEDISVPSPGEYTLRVWTRDAAGNHAEANARTATLRFDPTVPPETGAAYEGWIRRNDFEHEARWAEVDPSALGPSGLAGYAVRVSQSPDTDPCVTAAHPASSCAPAEVNNQGRTDTTMPISADQVSEGQWYIHVVPVTGAGVKAGRVEHTPMPVDESDPRTAISGSTSEWVNRDVVISVSARDSGSGMEPDTGRYSADPQPRTCLQIGVAAPRCEPDSSITRVVASQGDHRVHYFARDLAGNENNGKLDVNGRVNNPPRTATVRIDKSAPRLAFATRTVDDPSRIVVNASDALSGIAGGAIELRRQGSTGDWLELDTTVAGRRLSGHVPDDLDPGRYEFRAMATDRAGNARTTSRRADGSPMVEELPLKEAVQLTARVEGAQAAPPKGDGKRKCKKAGRKGRGKGKRKCKKRAPAVAATVPYGRPVQLAGQLRTAADAPLRGRELIVSERFAGGATPAGRTHTVVTNRNGAYSLGLAAGPSRRVTVHYPGEVRYRPTTSAPVDAEVRSKVLSFKSPKRVPEKRPIRFRGRVGALGVDLGARGKRVELQYEKSKRNWRTIDSGEARAKGRFQVRYGLRSNYARKTRVRFRVLVPAERAWPYSGTATSRPRKTVILP